MTQQRFLASWTLEDDKGRKASLPIYGLYNDASVDLAAVLAWMDATSVQIDAITEAKVISQSLSIYPALGAGLKADPVANCDVQETGLFTFPLNGLTAKSFSIDVPAFLQSAFVGNEINTTVTAVDDFLTTINDSSGGIGATDDVWAHFLETVRKARKSFRKLGGR